MNRLQSLKTILEEIISLEQGKSVDDLASYIVGEIFGEYFDLYESNPTIEWIGEIASDIEARNSADGDWQRLKDLIAKL